MVVSEGKDVRLVADTHTHTIASGHAYNTLDELVREASKKGLEVIAITDHTPAMPGGAHAFHFANLRVIPNEMYGVRILKGAETNIMDYEGHIDLEEDTLKGLDMAIASLHPPCIPFGNKEEVTSCLEKVMENPYINIIGHPGDARYPIDMERLVKKAKETKTLLEVNIASLRPTSYRPGVRENLVEMLKYCKDYENPIILGSDAHFHLDVGMFDEGIALLEELEFPEHLVLNTDAKRLIAYISQKRLK